MARWLDIALSWKQRGATGAKWPRHQRRGKEVQHWDLKNPGAAFRYPYYHIQFFRFISIQIHAIDIYIYFCDDSLKHRLMVSHHVLTLTCICSHQGYAYCVYSDRCMGATQPVSQSNPACRPAWLLFVDYLPTRKYVSSCTVWCVGRKTEKSAKSMIINASNLESTLAFTNFYHFGLQSLVFQSASDWIPDRCPHAMQPCDPSSAFFGFMGVTSALVFANLGAAPQRTFHRKINHAMTWHCQVGRLRKFRCKE